jgi:hypothetical protein
MDKFSSMGATPAGAPARPEFSEDPRGGPGLSPCLLWDKSRGRRLRGAPFVAATFDLDQRDRLILVNAKGERGARQHAVD